MKDINCIICNKNEFELFSTFNLNIGNYTLVKCIKCDFVFLNPRINEEDISKFYDSNYQPFQKKISFINIIYKFLRKVNFFLKYRIITKYMINKGTNLDLGSGDNFFSKSMNSNGWKSFNYDKYYISNSNIRDLSSFKSNSFNSITLWHSIEHMYDINSIFKNINKLLTKDGYLFIACPNLNASEIQYLKNNWIAFDIPRHLYHFNFNTMQKFLNKNNFKIVNIDNLKMDSLFNIFMSKNTNVLYKIFIYLHSLIVQYLNKKKSSTIVYICKLK